MKITLQKKSTRKMQESLQRKKNHLFRYVYIQLALAKRSSIHIALTMMLFSANPFYMHLDLMTLN